MNILNDPNNKLTLQQRNYFTEMSYYIELPLYFIGSIARYDYIPGKSDIDLEVYSENEISTLFKLLHFLNINKNSVKLIYFTCNEISLLGYKLSCKHYFNEIDSLHFDIAIYTMDSKKILLPHRIRDIKIPMYSSVFLLIVKYMYYHGKIINKPLYSRLKRLNVLHVNPDKSRPFTFHYEEYIKTNIHNDNKDNIYFVKLYK